MSPAAGAATRQEDALAQAQAVAGDKDVGIGGGANVIQHYLAAGLVDKLRLHLDFIIRRSRGNAFL
jgi:dihydrofolate reductase